MGTIDSMSPGFKVAAVAGATRLLSNEEADVMVRMVRGLETSEAEYAALVQGAIPVSP